MNNKRIEIITTLALCLLAAGCAPGTSDASGDENSFRATSHLIFQPGFADRSFSSSSDYMVSTGFNDVTYIWPKGKGNFSKNFNEITFEGESIRCTVAERRLTINERRTAGFEEGDQVRITGEGKIFVNDVELKQ